VTNVMMLRRIERGGMIIVVDRSKTTAMKCDATCVLEQFSLMFSLHPRDLHTASFRECHRYEYRTHWHYDEPIPYVAALVKINTRRLQGAHCIDSHQKAP
jgi:hypothetical protein